MPRLPILLLAALKHESDFIARNLRDASDIRLRIIGPGATRMPEAGELNGVAGIIMVGLAGGLDPTLRCGDVVIDSLSTWTPLGDAFRRGFIQTTHAIVSTAGAKSALFRETGALVVDMENAAARDLAKSRNLPFLGIRAVCDTADESLDPAIARLTDPAGDVHAGRVATMLLRRPMLIGDLLRLRSQSSLALRNLADALNQILASRSLSS